METSHENQHIEASLLVDRLVQVLHMPSGPTKTHHVPAWILALDVLALDVRAVPNTGLIHNDIVHTLLPFSVQCSFALVIALLRPSACTLCAHCNQLNLVFTSKSPQQSSTTR